MSEGHQGIALAYHRPPSGLVPGGELQGTHRQGGAGIPGPQLRASFQRAALPEPFFVPVHHPYHEGTHAAAEQLLRPLQGAYPPQGGPGQGRHPPLPGSRGAVRAYHLRFRAGPSERLTTEEITGKGKEAGLVEKYFSLSQEDTTTLEDIRLGGAEMRVGDKRLSVHTLSDADDLPSAVRTDGRYEKYSTDRSDCRLSFAAPVGLMLPYNHICNQYVFIDDPAETLRHFEKAARNMRSLSRYSRANEINRQWTEEYLNEAHSFGLVPVRCHCNVMAWSEDRERLRNIRNDTGSAWHRWAASPGTIPWTRRPLLGGHPRRRVIFPPRSLPHVHRTGGMPLHRGDEPCLLPLALRHQDGGPAQRQAHPSGHLGRADEAGHHDQPQQIHPGAFGQRQVLLHQPSRAQLLRAGRAHPAGGHGKQLQGAVPAHP